MFCVFLHFFRSEIQFFRQKSAIWSSDSFERQFLVHSEKNTQLGSRAWNRADRWSIAKAAPFPSKYTIGQPRFQANITSNQWYIAHIFQI